MIFYSAQDHNYPAHGFRSMMRSAAGHVFDAANDVGSAYYHGAGHLAHHAVRAAAGSALATGAAINAGLDSWDQHGGGHYDRSPHGGGHHYDRSPRGGGYY